MLNVNESLDGSNKRSNNAYLLECGRYIERNPLNARMVQAPDRYKWSSAAFYALGAENALVSENPLFRGLASTLEECREIYGEFVRRDRPYEAAVENVLFGKNLIRGS